MFSPDFNSQIRLFYAEKWNFLKKLGPLLDVFFSESTSNERKVLNKTHAGHVHNMGYITKTTYQTAGCLKNISHGTFTRDALSEPVASTILMFPRANCCCSGNSK